LGAYFELGLRVELGDHLELGVDGRMIYWQGVDGFRNTGNELSAAVGIRLTTVF
jgi:hypothetical protein